MGKKFCKKVGREREFFKWGEGRGRKMQIGKENNEVKGEGSGSNVKVVRVSISFSDVLFK